LGFPTDAIVWAEKRDVGAIESGSLACAMRTRQKSMRTDQHFRSELDLSNVNWSRVDATTDAEIVRQAAEDEETAPILTAEEILAAGRRVSHGEIEDV
jgi:hypothetical protein